MFSKFFNDYSNYFCPSSCGSCISVTSSRTHSCTNTIPVVYQRSSDIWIVLSSIIMPMLTTLFSYAHIQIHKYLNNSVIVIWTKSSNGVLSAVGKPVLLGFNISNTLSWNGHVEHITEKISISLLRLCRKYLNNFAARQFYFQFVHCHFINGIHIYQNLSTNFLMDKLFVLQITALRLVCSLHMIPPHFIPSSILFRSLVVLPIPTSLIYFTDINGLKILSRLNSTCWYTRIVPFFLW